MLLFLWSLTCVVVVVVVLLLLSLLFVSFAHTETRLLSHPHRASLSTRTRLCRATSSLVSLLLLLLFMTSCVYAVCLRFPCSVLLVVALSSFSLSRSSLQVDSFAAQETTVTKEKTD